MNSLSLQDSLAAKAGVLAVVPNLANGSVTVNFTDGATAMVQPDLRDSLVMDIYEGGNLARSEVLGPSISTVLPKVIELADRASAATH